MATKLTPVQRRCLQRIDAGYNRRDLLRSSFSPVTIDTLIRQQLLTQVVEAVTGTTIHWLYLTERGQQALTPAS